MAVVFPYSLQDRTPLKEAVQVQTNLAFNSEHTVSIVSTHQYNPDRHSEMFPNLLEMVRAGMSNAASQQ